LTAFRFRSSRYGYVEAMVEEAVKNMRSNKARSAWSLCQFLA
jgi:hypothetical protein